MRAARPRVADARGDRSVYVQGGVDGAANAGVGERGFGVGEGGGWGLAGAGEGVEGAAVVEVGWCEDYGGRLGDFAGAESRY